MVCRRRMEARANDKPVRDRRCLISTVCRFWAASQDCQPLVRSGIKMEYPPAARPPVVKRGRAIAYASRGLGVYVWSLARSAGVPSFYLLRNLDLISGDEEVVPKERKMFSAHPAPLPPPVIARCEAPWQSAIPACHSERSRRILPSHRIFRSAQDDAAPDEVPS